jgi:hypothetical protein
MNVDDISEEIAHTHLVIKECRRRLRSLEVQKAKYGKDCPPHVINEIEDINNEIQILEQRLNVLQGNTQINREQVRPIINPYSATSSPSKQTVQLQGSQTEISSSLLQKYYHTLLKYKAWIVVSTVTSLILFISSLGYSLGKTYVRWAVLPLFLFSMTSIGIGLVCGLYAANRRILSKILLIISALFFGLIGIFALVSSLQTLIAYIINS